MRFSMFSSATWVLLLMAMGCSPSDPPLDPIAEVCGGARPVDVTGCKGNGFFFADCGGDGEPILACHESTGGCAWFSHGCAPVGFRITACPIGNPCCVSTSDGSWPFADGWRPATGMATVILAEDIAAMGHVPVTASSPASIVVTVDASLPSAAPGVSCAGSGVETLELCNGDPPQNTSPLSSRNTLWVRFANRDLLAEALILEIVPETETGIDAPIARVFVRFEDDAAPPDVPLACERARSPRLDLTGTLTVNGIDLANPSATHGHLVLDLPGGGRATIDF